MSFAVFAMPALTMTRAVPAVLLLLGLCACGSAPKAPPTLYERLGGTPQLERVVGRLVDRAAADPQALQSLQALGAGTVAWQPAPLKRSLVLQLCQVAGGGCVGEPAAAGATGLRINDSRFHPLVGLLREELDRAHVPPRAKEELLRVISPARPASRQPLTDPAPAVTADMAARRA